MSHNAFTVDLVRHSTSDYENYLALEQVGSDPNQYVDYKNQVPDLNAAGVALAEQKAREYAEQINPETEIVVLISSKEMRAYQTSLAFIKALEARGIEIYSGIPSQQGEQHPVGIAENISGVKVDERVVTHQAPSLDYQAIWVEDMLEPPINSRNTTFRGLDESRLTPDDASRYQAARDIIEREGDTSSGWGANYKKYQGQGYPFDIIPSAQANRDKMVNGLKLLRRIHGNSKTNEFEQAKGKRLRYMVFTHEENLLDMAGAYFNEARIGNCDRLSLQVPIAPNEFMVAEFHGREAKMSYLMTQEPKREHRFPRK